MDLQWWSAGGLRTNKVCSWCMPRPDVTVLSDASPWAGSAVSDDGFSFQKTWDEKEEKCHINFLVLGVARIGFRELVYPGLTVQPYLDNMPALTSGRREELAPGPCAQKASGSGRRSVKGRSR